MQNKLNTPPSKKRIDPRYAANSNGVLTLNGKTSPCVIVNISRAGAMLQGVANLDVGVSFDLAIDGVGLMKATVSWTSEYGFGVSFAPPKLNSDDYSDKMNLHLKKLVPLSETKSINGFW